jgi:hypothetical protein
MTSSKSTLINTLMRPISHVDWALIFLKMLRRNKRHASRACIAGEFANAHCLSCGRSKLRQRKVLTWMILVDDLNRHSDLNVLRIDIDDVTADERPFV